MTQVRQVCAIFIVLKQLICHLQVKKVSRHPSILIHPFYGPTGHLCDDGF